MTSRRLHGRQSFPHLGCIVALLLGSALLPARAGEGIDRLTAFFAGQGGIRAEFVQTVEGAAFSQPKRSTGILMMQRPGRFRWEYVTPYQQSIIADGRRLWIYDPDLAQVIVKPVDEALGETPALLLSGGSSWQERFVAAELPEPRDGLRWVQLQPRHAEAGFEVLRLGFGPLFLARMELVDGFGQVTTLQFSAMQENVVLPPQTFQFTAPKGVDVIGQP